MATFKIADASMTSDYGFVLISFITDNKTIKVGDFVEFIKNGQIIDLDVRGFKIMDKDSEKKAHMKLYFTAQDYKKGRTHLSRDQR